MKRHVILAALGFAALGAAATAQTIDIPVRKAGLWEMAMKMESPPGMPAMAMQQCTDEATDKAMTTMFGGPQQICSEHKMQRNGSTITVDSVCTVAGVKSTSRAVITGDFNSAYTMKVTSKREGGAAKSAMMAPGGGDTSMTIEAKWAGPCKADQKPGDIVMPGGMKMNVSDMQKFRGMMAPPK